jgi:tetratricopeptide (TPR) repeat protein
MMSSHIPYFIITILVILIILSYSVDSLYARDLGPDNEYFIFMDYANSHSLLELGKKYHYGSDYIKQNHAKAINIYKLAITNGDMIAHLYLGILYMDVHKIDEAIASFHQAVDKGFFQCFINLGDIYFYEKQYVDIELSQEYYNAAIKYSTSPTHKYLAIDKLNILLSESKDTYYQKEPEVVMDLDTLRKYNIEDELDEIVQRQTVVPGYDQVLNGVAEHTHVESEVRKNDPQNVHDHVVSNTVKRSIENLIKYTTLIFDIPKTLIDIRSFIKLQSTNVDVALRVLDHIEQDHSIYRDTKLKQVDVLHLIWNRIHNDCNKDILEKLQNNLYHRIIECNEYDSNVCASGIFSRLIDTLNYCDGENIVQIIPKYVLNKELMDKASVISKTFMEEQDAKIKMVLTKPTDDPEDHKICLEYTERLKQHLISEFRKEYIETNIISEDILFLEINRWIDYI